MNHFKKPYLLYLSALLMLLSASCVTSNHIHSYYNKNKIILDSIHQTFNDLQQAQPFSIVFKDLYFKQIGIEIITDTLRYVYEFGTHEERMKDTLKKYHLQATSIQRLMTQMQTIRCIWISKLHYYIKGNQQSVIVLSVQPGLLPSFFSDKQYLVFAYFSASQSFDKAGVLLHDKKLIRKINANVFKRINDNVCYTIANKFR